MVVGTIMNVPSAAKSSHHMQNIKAMYKNSIEENGLTGVACAVKFLITKNKKVSISMQIIDIIRRIRQK
jgi:hypothetical protein